jgi:hypothetical protein
MRAGRGRGLRVAVGGDETRAAQRRDAGGPWAVPVDVWWWFAARSQISSYGREQQRRSGYGSERRGSGEQSETQQTVKTQQASPCSSRGDGLAPACNGQTSHAPPEAAWQRTGPSNEVRLGLPAKIRCSESARIRPHRSLALQRSRCGSCVPAAKPSCSRASHRLALCQRCLISAMRCFVLCHQQPEASARCSASPGLAPAPIAVL